MAHFQHVMGDHDGDVIYACICGNAVDVEERVMGSETAVRCGSRAAQPHGYVIDIHICFIDTHPLFGLQTQVSSGVFKL